MRAEVKTMAVPPGTELPAPHHGGRPRDPSRDEAIRAALLRLLGEVGYGGLTVDAVAEQAGVGKATIYRRWPSKQDLIVDSISELGSVLTVPPDTGSLREDIRQFMHLIVEVTRSPIGAMLQSLVSAMHHHPELRAAYRAGPLTVWRNAYAQMWARAEARGEVTPGLASSPMAETTSALIVQRWLLTDEPVNEEYADRILDTVVMPLLRHARPTRP
jgi:AcrR family transcriptional regulator